MALWTLYGEVALLIKREFWLAQKKRSMPSFLTTHLWTERLLLMRQPWVSWSLIISSTLKKSSQGVLGDSKRKFGIRFCCFSFAQKFFLIRRIIVFCSAFRRSSFYQASLICCWQLGVAILGVFGWSRDAWLSGVFVVVSILLSLGFVSLDSILLSLVFVFLGNSRVDLLFSICASGLLASYLFFLTLSDLRILLVVVIYPPSYS